MGDVKWIRITTDMFDNRKIKHIRKLPEGNNIILIWVMLLTMAGRCNASGMIFLTENIPYTKKMLADELGFDESVISIALSALEKFGMVFNDGVGIISIPGWREYQNADGLEKIREQTKRRVAKHRENTKNLKCNGSSNATVTLCNAIEREEERDIEEDKDIEKENTKESAIPYFDVENAWIETYKIYPKKSGEATAKVEWMKKVGHSLDIKEVSKLVFFATKLYLSDYSGKYPDDVNYKFLPRYDKWLQEDCDYWIRQYEEKQRGDDS